MDDLEDQRPEETWAIYFQDMGIRFCVRESQSTQGANRGRLTRDASPASRALGKARSWLDGGHGTVLYREQPAHTFPSVLWLQKDGQFCEIVVPEFEKAEKQGKKKNKQEEQKPPTTPPPPPPKVGLGRPSELKVRVTPTCTISDPNHPGGMGDVYGP